MQENLLTIPHTILSNSNPISLALCSKSFFILALNCLSVFGDKSDDLYDVILTMASSIESIPEVDL